MKLEITEKKQNPLINRLEVKGQLDYEGQATPTTAQVREAVAKALHTETSLVDIQQIGNRYGTSRGNVRAVVYQNAAVQQKYSTSTKHLRKMEEEQKKKAAEATS